MDYYKILKSCHGAAEEMRKLDLEKDKEHLGSEENRKECFAYIEKYGGNIDNIVATGDLLDEYYYAEYESGVYLPLTIFSVSFLKIIQFEKLQKYRDAQIQHLKAGEYQQFYHRVPDKFLIQDFEFRYQNIPKDKIADVWLNCIYTKLSYGFSQMNPEIVNYVFQQIKSSEDKTVLTIYRGEGLNATPLDSAYSWTTDINIALWFAGRGIGRRVWKGKVRTCDVAFFVDGRSAKEVIVKPELVFDVEDMWILSTDLNTFIPQLDSIREEAVSYREMLKEAYSETDCEIHGPGHVARVLLLALLLANLEEIEEKRIRQLLAVAVIFHDCGRKTDCCEPDHGLHSAERAMRILENDIYPLKYTFTELEREMIYYAIKYHSLPDGLGLAEIDNSFSGEGREVAKQLFYILKDADALDRVRLGKGKDGLNVHYLRLPNSIKLSLMAYRFFNGQMEELLINNNQKDN